MAEAQNAAANSAAAREAAFNATVAKAREMSGGGKVSPPPAAASSDDSETEETEEASTTDAGESDESGEAGEVVEKPAASADASKALELLIAGDLAGMVKALGGDPKLAETSDRKFRALREREAKLDRKDKAHEKKRQAVMSELTGLSQQIAQQRLEFARENKFLKDTRSAVAEKNWPAVAKGLEAFTGMDLATLTQKLARGKTGLSEEDKQLAAERDHLARERQEFEAKKKNEEGAKTVAQQRTEALGKFEQQLSAHPVFKVTKGFETRAKKRLNQAFEMWEKSWDSSARRFTKTPAQCADELQREIDEDAKANGYKPAKASTPAAKRGAEPPRVATSKDSVTAAQKSFEDRVAMARRQASLRSR